MLSFVTSVSIEKTLEAEIKALPPHDRAQVDAILHNIGDCLARLADSLLSADLVCVPVGDLLFWLVRRHAGGLNWGLVCITDDILSPDQPPTGELLRSIADIFGMAHLSAAIANIQYAYPIEIDDLPIVYDEHTSARKHIFDVQFWSDHSRPALISKELVTSSTSEHVRSLLAGLVTMQHSNELRIRDLLAPAFAATDESEGAFVPGTETSVPTDHDLNLSDKP